MKKRTPSYPWVTVVHHPLIDHSLSIIREKTTQTEDFRRHGGIVSMLLFLHAAKKLKLESYDIQTPLSPMKGKRLKKNVIVVPVLRSGIGMLFALEDLLPSAAVGFIGLARDEKTAQAHEYYQKLPKIFSSNIVFLVDPMLATGGSLIDSLAILIKKGAKNITVICIVSAPEGLERIHKQYPDVKIITAAIDTHLNDTKFIVPGLGDFGDRYFGTIDYI